MPVGYGRKIRKAVDSVKAKSKKKYRCPACSRIAVKRLSAGVWQCQKCKKKIASGAYEFKG